MFEIWVLEADTCEPVAGRREVDQPPAGADQGRNAVHRDKVPEVVGTKLHFEAVRSVGKRCSHYAGISDDYIEGFAFGEQQIGAGADAFETGQIEFHQLEAAAVCRGIASHFSGRGVRLGQVTSRADDLRAMCPKRLRRLDSESGGDTGDENPLAVQIYSRQDLIRGWSRAERTCHASACRHGVLLAEYD